MSRERDPGQWWTEAWSPVEWRDVPGWDGFKASNDGRILGPSGRVRKPQTNDDGYQYINHLATRGGKQLKLWVHHAVLLAFVGPRPDGLEARHIDGNKRNNRPDNLAWGDRFEQTEDKRRHGTLPTGDKSRTAKLTRTQVEEIRVSSEGMRALGRRYGVAHSTIRKILIGKAWGDV